MLAPRHPSAPPGRAGARLARIAVALTFLVSLAWPGCTVTRENYKTLSLFFDGVPDPDAVILKLPDGGVVTAAAGMLSIHRPYLEEKCVECHDSGLSMARNDAAVCLKCHQGKDREYPYMHGPVAARACLWCHVPHESARKHLLRDADRSMCGMCHAPGLLSASAVPEHADQSRGCLECHAGHGGPQPRMLRPRPAAPGAATQGGP